MVWTSIAQKNTQTTNAIPPPAGLSYLDAIDLNNDGYTSFHIAGYISWFRQSALTGFAHYDLSGYIIEPYARQQNNTLVPISTPFFTNTYTSQSCSLKAVYSGSGIQYDQSSLDVFLQNYGGDFGLRAVPYNGNIDNDGVVNALEDLNGNLNPQDDDTDGDGIPNYGDNDDDGDGISTLNEDYNGNGNPTDDDMNANGIADYLDSTARGTLPLNLKLYIEGYYIGSGLMKPVKFNQDGISPTTDVENITVELRKPAPPYDLSASTTAVLKTNGTVSCSFPTASVGSFYIVVKSRNGIETWSATPQNISTVALTYSFSTGINKAYGHNMKNLGGFVYGFYSGDITADNSIDPADYSAWEGDANQFAMGIQASDLNGDGMVDPADYSLWEGNANNFIMVARPQ